MQVSNIISLPSLRISVLPTFKNVYSPTHLKGNITMCKFNSIPKLVYGIKAAATLFGAVLLFHAAQANAATIANFQFNGSSLASVDSGDYWNTGNLSAGANLTPVNISVSQGNPAPGIEIQ